MSEGEGQYKPPTADRVTNRRTFLKDMFKAGAGAAVAIVGSEANKLPGVRSSTPETTPLAVGEPKVVLMESTTATEKPVGVRFQILKELDGVKLEDVTKVQKMPIDALGGTAVMFSQRMIDMALNNQTISEQQKEQITQAVIDFQAKLDHILAQSNP